MTNPGSIKGPTVTDAMIEAGREAYVNSLEPHSDDEPNFAAIYTAMEATRTATNRASEGELREALERISALRPSHANADTAMDLHLTVKAIADSALAREQAGGAP